MGTPPILTNTRGGRGKGVLTLCFTVDAHGHHRGRQLAIPEHAPVGLEENEDTGSPSPLASVTDL